MATPRPANPPPNPPPAVQIPMPAALNLSAGDLRDNFEAFEFAWLNYRVASGLSAKPQAAQLATLMCALGPAAQKLYLQLELSDAEHGSCDGVMAGLRRKLAASTNVRLERRNFNRAEQRADETYAEYFGRLRALLRRCQFGGPTIDDDFMLDRILASIRDRSLAQRMASAHKLHLPQAIAWCQRVEREQRDRDRAQPAQSQPQHQPQQPLSATKATEKRVKPAASPARLSAPALEEKRAQLLSQLTAPPPPLPPPVVVPSAPPPEPETAQPAVRAPPPSYAETMSPLANGLQQPSSLQVHAPASGQDSASYHHLSQQLDQLRSFVQQRDATPFVLVEEAAWREENERQQRKSTATTATGRRNSGPSNSKNDKCVCM